MNSGARIFIGLTIAAAVSGIFPAAAPFVMIPAVVVAGFFVSRNA